MLWTAYKVTQKIIGFDKQFVAGCSTMFSQTCWTQWFEDGENIKYCGNMIYGW